MPADPELRLRGGLARGLGALREMLPGSFIERRRQCGKPNCRCAKGKPDQMHVQYVLSVLAAGKLKTFHVPAPLAAETRRRVAMRRRFEHVMDRICEINLRGFLRRRGTGGSRPARAARANSAGFTRQSGVKT